MTPTEIMTAVESAAFGPGSAFELLQQSVPLQPLLQGVKTIIVDDSSFNAYAQQGLDTDTIGINAGTLSKITETIGKIDDSLPLIRKGSNLKAELWWDELSPDEVRTRLSRLCLDFVVFHELSHIALNHCLSSGIAVEHARLFEAPPGSQDHQSLSLRVETRHAFETFADKLSVSLLSSALPRLRTLHRRFVFKHPSAASSGMIWATQIVWATLAASSKDYVTEQESFLAAIRDGRRLSVPWFTHPHPSLRRAVAGSAFGVAHSNWLQAIGAGVQNADSMEAIDRFLSPDRPREARAISVLANSPKVVRRFKRACDAAWKDFRDRLLPFSRFQSSLFVKSAMERYGYHRWFGLEYGQGERSRILETLISETPPAFIANNDGRLPRNHWAYKL